MCIFSRPVLEMGATHIYVRPGPGISQMIVYQMSLKTKEEDKELAMILPIPCAGPDVKFIPELAECTGFFEDLQDLWRPRMRGAGAGRAGLVLGGRGAPLPVVAVGSFDASFVPSYEDMERLDERFQIPPSVFELHPEYQEQPWGFVVFKLRNVSVPVHPMGFCFQRACAGLHVPTVHAHDGRAAGPPKTMEDFNHRIYVQLPQHPVPVFGCQFERSLAEIPRPFNHTSRELATYCLQGMPIFRLVLKGSLPNRDLEIMMPAPR